MNHSLDPDTSHTLFCLTLLLVISLSTSLFSANGIDQVDTLLWNGDPLTHLQITIIGDGYTESETEEFTRHIGTPCHDYSEASLDCGDAQKLFQKIFSVSPFKEYSDYFNVVAISTVSNTHGIGPVTENNFDSYLGVSMVGEPGVDGEKGTIYGARHFNRTVMDKTIEQYSYLSRAILVISNANGHPFFGIAGGIYTYQIKHTMWTDIAVHELAHVIADLKDTYNFTADNEGPNITEDSDPNNAPWKEWIGTLYNDGEEIGMYPIKTSLNQTVYRPCETDKMNLLTEDIFCPVTKEVLIQQFNNRVLHLIDTISPENEHISIQYFYTRFSADIKKIGFNSTMDITWKLNGTILDRHINTIFIRADQLNIHTQNTLSLSAVDTTHAMRNPAARLTSEVQWFLTYSGGLSETDPPSSSAQQPLSSFINFPSSSDPGSPSSETLQLSINNISSSRAKPSSETPTYSIDQSTSQSSASSNLHDHVTSNYSLWYNPPRNRHLFSSIHSFAAYSLNQDFDYINVYSLSGVLILSTTVSDVNLHDVPHHSVFIAEYF